MMVRNALLSVVLVAAIGVGVATPIEAQRWSEPEERGWIGISFQVDSDSWGRPAAVLITDVSTGSPADEAGLRPGDRLLAINELRTASAMSELSERLQLRIGDRVVMEIERAGERRRLRLEASEPPAEVRFRPRVEYAYSPSDDQVETWVRSMDSLRIELVEMGGQNIRVQTTRGGAPGQVTVITSVGRTSVEAPFEFFVFRGEEHDSLKREMVQLNETMRDLERRLETRERQVRTRARSADPLHLAEDEEFRRLSRNMDEMSIRSAALEAAMAEAARETAGLSYAEPRAPVTVVGSESVPMRPSEPTTEFRPLTPYLLGRNRVAGAQVVDLQPELAVYFGVAGGVLVVDVAAGTPAGMAGIIPGDVIVRIDRVVVRSVDDLRFGVSMAADTLPVTVIRQGETAQVLLRR